MDEKQKKKRNLFVTLLEYLRTILVSFFGFLFSLFSKNYKKNYYSSKKIEKKIDSQPLDVSKKPEVTDFSSYHNEEPNTRINEHKSHFFSLTDEELKRYIQFLFCQELEMEERDLTLKQKEFLKELNDKMVEPIQKEIHDQNIQNSDSLKVQVKKVLKEHLEEQIKLEQTLDDKDEKIVIIPILLDKPPKRMDSLKKEFQPLLTPQIKPNVFVHPPVFKTSEPTIKPKVVQEIKLPSDKNINQPDASINLTNPTVSKNNFSNYDSPTFSNPTSVDIHSTNEINSYPDVVFSEVKSSLPSSSLSDSSREPSITIPPCDDIEFLEQPLDDTLFDTSFLEPLVEEPKKPVPEEVESQEKENTVLDFENQEQKKEKQESKEEKKPQEEEKEPQFDEINLSTLDKEIQIIELEQHQETKKENLEDKDYTQIEQQIYYLLEKIAKLKLKNLSPEQQKALQLKEAQVLQLKNQLHLQKQKEIEYETSILEETIMNQDLNYLELELQKLHLENQLDLNQRLLNQVEDLALMSKEKASQIEKELLKLKLQKAVNAMEVTSLLSLPFVRNKYFLFFTMGLFVNRHLKFFDSILKRKTIDYEPEEIAHIKKGSHALEDAVNLNQQNLEYINYLEKMAVLKYPELSYDHEFLLYLNQLKFSLVENQEKMAKKKKMIEKYHIKNVKQIRTLKKKNKVA